MPIMVYCRRVTAAGWQCSTAVMPIWLHHCMLALRRCHTADSGALRQAGNAALLQAGSAALRQAGNAALLQAGNAALR
jgi:hypothetical protein